MTIDMTALRTDRRARLDVCNPENDELLATLVRATSDDVEAALAAGVVAAVCARRLPTHERMRVLTETARLIERDSEEFAHCIAQEGVKTIREARSEVARCVGTLRLSAEEARRRTGETIAFDQRPGSALRSGHYVLEPVGLIVAITPFNDTLNLIAHKVGPAIAAGNAIIVKPHEKTPLTALKFVDALTRAGLGADVVQVLLGDGAEIGPRLVADRRVCLVTFTGGYEVGRRIAHHAGLKRLEMELGGNCPTLVLADANLEAAAEACVSGAFAAAGQNCLHVQRIIVERSVYAPFRERLLAGTQSLRLGSKLDERTDMGCLIDRTSAKRIGALLSSAVLSGASIICGGESDGVAMAPTLIEGVAPRHALARDEVFGPVTVLSAADGLADAIEKANATDFGLQAGVFTSDLHAAQAAIDHIRAGAVLINDTSDYRLDAMPFGGSGRSGLGREGVRSAMIAMTEPKVVCFNRAIAQGSQPDEEAAA